MSEDKMTDFNEFKKQVFIEYSYEKETKRYVCIYCKCYGKYYKNIGSFKAHMKTKTHIKNWDTDKYDNILLDYYTKNNEHYIPEIGGIIFDYVGRDYERVIKSLREIGRTEEQINEYLDWTIEKEKEGRHYIQMIR